MTAMRAPFLLPGFLAVGLAAGCAPPPDGAAPAASPPSVVVAGYEPAGAERLAAAGWRTDFSHRTVPPGAIRTRDLPRDAIVPIRSPQHASAAETDLDPAEPVLVVRGAEEVRAWPLVHLLNRELAVDRADGVPVAVTFCSVCGTARVWDRRVAGRVLDLGVSGMLLDGNSLLFDHATESLWRQIDGAAVAGAMAGAAMESVPAFVISFGALAAARPDALVMLPPDPAPDPPFRTLTGNEVARGELPAWLEATCARPLEPALAAADGDAIPLAGPAVEVRGDLVIFRDPRTGTAYRSAGGGPSPPWSAAGAFHRELNGRKLTFQAAAGGGPGVARDEETGSTWSLLGEAVEGPLAGRSLRVADQVSGFRFAVAGS
jgi:hypothetical protein